MLSSHALIACSIFETSLAVRVVKQHLTMFVNEYNSPLTAAQNEIYLFTTGHMRNRLEGLLA